MIKFLHLAIGTCTVKGEKAERILYKKYVVMTNMREGRCINRKLIG